MGASQSIIKLHQFGPSYSPRRAAIHTLAIAALVVATVGAATLRAQERNRIPAIYMPPDTRAERNIVIPTPEYLPAGYELFRVFREPVDGFMTGNAEIEFDYIDKSCWARKTMCPL